MRREGRQLLARAERPGPETSHSEVEASRGGEACWDLYRYDLWEAIIRNQGHFRLYLKT